MMFAVTFEYINIFTIEQGVRDFGTQAVVSVASNNSYSAFIGVKEGNTYSVSIDTNDVKERLTELLQLNNNMEKYVDGKLKFSIKDLNVQFVNADYSAEDNSVTLNFLTTLTLTVPIRFGADLLPPDVKVMKFKSTYVPLF